MNQHPADRPDQPERPTDPKTRENPRSRQMPRYQLILHHDAVSDLMLVVRTMMELTRFCRAEATHKMWQAYHLGRAVILVTHKERAELYVEQFAGRGVAVTIEPV